MGTLTPEAFAKLYSEMVESARKAGWPGVKNSPGFIRRMELEYDAEFAIEQRLAFENRRK